MEKKHDNEIVSIIIPVYNTEKFIKETIKSILNQSYSNWEAIFIDDCSNDNSPRIIHDFMKTEPRIKYFKTERNSGAAICRNMGISIASGTYIAFLDDDDLWYPEKLKTQIDFMQKNNYNFSCTFYDKINENGENLGIVVKNKRILNYNSLLKYNPGNSTVIYNAKNLGKTYIPDIRKRNDYLMWLKVIKKSNNLYTLEIVLGSHRIRKSSLSSNKKNLVKYHWEIYRKIEKINIVKSTYLILFYGIKTIKSNILLVVKRKKIK